MKSTLVKSSLLNAAFWMTALCGAALAAGTPKLQFDQTVYDFGKTSMVETVSGTFKFKNVGDALLKLEPPKPSCGCTIAGLKPDILKPGESGELAFTLNLGHARANMEKHISVASNDPQSPEVSLTIKVDYTPLYDMNPPTLVTNLEFGVNHAVLFTSLTRTDGKPLHILSLSASKPWVMVQAEPDTTTNASTVRFRITIQRDGPPRRFNEYVHVYTTDQTNSSVATIYLFGQMLGEVSVSPEALYWSVTDGVPQPTGRLEAMVMRQMTVRSASGTAFELKNPQSSIPGIHFAMVRKEAGKVYELTAKLDQTPAQTVSGNVSFETSVAAQPRIEVPVIVNVFKPSVH